MHTMYVCAGLPTPPPGSGPTGSILDLPDFNFPPPTASSQLVGVPASTPPPSRTLLADLNFGSLGQTPPAAGVGVGIGLGTGMGTGLGTGVGMGVGMGLGTAAGTTVVATQPATVGQVPPLVSGTPTALTGVPPTQQIPSIPDQYLPLEAIQIGECDSVTHLWFNGHSCAIIQCIGFIPINVRCVAVKCVKRPWCVCVCVAVKCVNRPWCVCVCGSEVCQKTLVCVCVAVKCVNRPWCVCV